MQYDSPLEGIWECKFPPWGYIRAGNSGNLNKEGTIPVRKTVFAVCASNKPTKPGKQVEKLKS